MYSLLVLALLLALLFEPAAAAAPIIDSALPAPPMESFYQDPDGLLAGICDLCGNLLDLCGHAVVSLSFTATLLASDANRYTHHNALQRSLPRRSLVTPNGRKIRCRYLKHRPTQSQRQSPYLYSYLRRTVSNGSRCSTRSYNS